jgi:hypothetical protein
MSEVHFTEEDKQKVIEFMNMVAKHAKFEFNTQEVITYFRLLSHMQTKILPKVEANIFEIVKVAETSPDAVEPKAKGKK